MLKHLLKYAIRILAKGTDGMVWGILFPLGFGLIYMFAFSGLISGTQNFDPVPVAIAYEGTNEEIKQARELLLNLGSLGEVKNNQVIDLDDNQNDLITFIETNNETETKALIDNGVLKMAVYANNSESQLKLALEVAPAAVNEVGTSIVYSALNSFLITNNAYLKVYETAATSTDPPQALAAVTDNLAEINNNQAFVIDSSQKAGVNSRSNFYYVCLAYICIFFMSVGVNLVTANEAKYKLTALRETISPVPKHKRFFSTFLIWLVPCLSVVYFLLGVYWLNDIPLGSEYGRIMVIMTIGVLVGLLLGTALAGLLKAKEGILTGIATALPLLFGALSGLLSYELKAVIIKNFPWMAKINPVSLINDAFYYLNNYPTYQQYNENLVILAIYTVVLLAITLISLRRTDYESL